MAIGKQATGMLSGKTYQQVMVSGLGGSGIGASIVADYCFDLIKIPLLINKNYFIPASVNRDTLFIACSYSGNTEETLEAVKQAKQKKADIICITSGGALSAFAEKYRLPCILIPGGMPPRSCLGYSMVQILFVLKQAGILKSKFESELMNGLSLISREEKRIHRLAGQMAAALHNQHIAIYTTAGYEGLAIRFRQQLNENGKVLAWHNVIPEMTHNEIVGWKDNHEDLTVVCCYHPHDYPKYIKRLKYLRKVVGKFKPRVTEIVLQGESYWERALYYIHLTDWVSVYLADLNGHDATEVKVIDGLKKEMAKK